MTTERRVKIIMKWLRNDARMIMTQGYLGYSINWPIYFQYPQPTIHFNPFSSTTIGQLSQSHGTFIDHCLNDHFFNDGADWISPGHFSPISNHFLNISDRFLHVSFPFPGRATFVNILNFKSSAGVWSDAFSAKISKLSTTLESHACHSQLNHIHPLS